MSKFNLSGASLGPRPGARSSAKRVATGATYEGAPGYARDAKSELFLLAVTQLGRRGHLLRDRRRPRRPVRATWCAALAVADPDWTARSDRLAAHGREPALGALVAAAEFVARAAGRRHCRWQPRGDRRRCCGGRTSPASCWRTGCRGTAGRCRSRSSAGVADAVGAAVQRAVPAEVRLGGARGSGSATSSS